MAETIVALVAVFFLLLLSAMMSASETAFFSLEPDDINEVKERRQPSDTLIAHLLGRSDYMLSAILIVNTFANVTIVMSGAYVMSRWVDCFATPLRGWLLLVVLLIGCILLFGEIMPKVYAQQHPLRVLRKVAKMLRGIEFVCRPLSNLLVHSTTLINKAMGRQKHGLSVDELSKALELTSTQLPEEKEMLEEIIKFYNKTASEIMTSRLDVEDIEIKTPFRDVLQFVVDSGYSRIPVYVGTEDTIKGILYIKDLLPYIDKPNVFHWQSLIRPAYFVPETKKIDDLLEEFRTNKIHMAIVVDEFGGTSGIVTMEDILEEIVGDISDEYDEDERQYIRLADGSLIFEAKIALNDFFRVADCDPSEFEELTDEVETLAGLLLELKGDFPKRREIIEYRGYQFQVLEVDDRRIQKVKFTRIPESGDEEN